MANLRFDRRRGGHDMRLHPFHLITVNGDRARDHGPLPVRGASKLLIAGERAALMDGYGPEYDLITPLQVTTTGIVQRGPARRLVRPTVWRYCPAERSATARPSASSQEVPQPGTGWP